MKDSDTLDKFLTPETSVGLRITIISILKLSKILLEDGFDFVLTAKMNQDPLEKMFGISRHCAGQNDHPSAITFLQLYKLLPLYAAIRPPKTGNCTVNIDEGKTIITIKEIQKLKHASDEKVKKDLIGAICNKIDQVIETNNNFGEDIIEFGMESAPSNTEECTIDANIRYYYGGFVAKKFKSTVSCSTCIDMFNAGYSGSGDVNSEIVSLKSRG
jgi:hypothetical protein